ncbi:Na+/H+ antiporter NhaC [Dethiosulfatibacter aminovorans DSM 17477]|uniref:Na+/H+ antiporter NhaC n=1 Tax=Dethiosulfatibacter aminovorans DSM 17477 TaxID=1121476 RepID=A0A1M6APN2_9FIRM|nr:Na+/H+ antiporter NhaC family protein [Dethiosulfatibacter aminovorans]SHI38288.1 Na+/H+ antiporter NhaC [Dethiosulfatibacter aminovorans DSM 17477]
MEHVGILSLLPVFLAITIAIKFKNVIPALFIGVFAGVMILVGGNPITAITTMIKEYVFTQLTDSYNAGVLVLLVFIGGFVGLMEKSGGAAAFAKLITKIVDNRFKAQIATWLGGIIVFFSDLGTPLIVGPISEPLFDKLRVSREKLAWIIDSTASPVAVLVPFIGWGVYVMGLIQKEFEALGVMESDWTAFIKAIPFQFYPIMAVTMVPLVAFTGYEFSAMAKAERRILDTGERYWPNSSPLRMANDEVNKNSRAILIWLPLIVLFVTLFGILAPLGFPFKKVPGSAFRTALSTGYLFAAITIISLMVKDKVNTLNESFDIYFKGMNKMMNVAVILVLAWALGTVGKGLGTANYIIEVTQGTLPGWAVPCLVFLIGAVMSFATGSSWGTFAIMMPLVIPMAVTLGSPIHVCIGAVLSGGLFGDHCSPISDTTILASTGAGCDHIDHVKTQIPYALLNGVISFMAYIVAGLTGSVTALGLAVVVLVASMIFLSKRFGTKIPNTTIEEIERMKSQIKTV